jgi:hypothetical protein
MTPFPQVHLTPLEVQNLPEPHPRVEGDEEDGPERLFTRFEEPLELRLVQHSGIIISTGTGATGWARSIQGERAHRLELPTPTAPALAFMVREAFPSVGLGTAITQGLITADETLEVVSERESDAAIFADGIEEDRIEPHWGQRLTIGVASRVLTLAMG